MEQVANRPYFIRVIFLAELNTLYQHARNGSLDLVKSLSSMRCHLQQTDRTTMMDLVLESQPQAGAARANTVKAKL